MTQPRLPQRNKDVHLHKKVVHNVHINIFHDSLRVEQCKFSSTNEWINKMLYFY